MRQSQKHYPSTFQQCHHFNVLQKMTKFLKSFAELARVIIQSDLTLV
ncbi:TPA: hypothetical protein R1930_001585 [Staphylococcus delphini]|nr:hypothetical protein [Staphylococcus delphini]HEC2202703.1 hypothetical protein [Staphylococcus delphini]HEC2205825.1 hypothetical protein [Staphylococcus delphini]HEC2228176.1 hypothetical protein [Staphylococcus delphini]